MAEYQMTALINGWTFFLMDYEGGWWLSVANGQPGQAKTWTFRGNMPEARDFWIGLNDWLSGQPLGFEAIKNLVGQYLSKNVTASLRPFLPAPPGG